MARAIEDLGYDSVWLGEHLLYRWPDRPPRGPWEAWALLAGRRRGHEPDRVRAARRLHELPQPGRCSPSRPPRSTRSAAAGSSSASAPAGTRPSSGVRLPVRPPDRPVRGGVHDHPDAAARRRDRLRRAVLPGPRLRAAAARAAAGRSAADDRLERPADAPASRCRTSIPGTRWYADTAQRARPASPRSATIVDAACRDVGRDPADVERTVAVQVRMPGGTRPR